MFYLPLEGVIDLDAERKRLAGEIGKVEELADRFDARLKDGAFLSKAPADVVEKEREKLAAVQDKLDRLRSLQSQLL